MWARRLLLAVPVGIAAAAFLGCPAEPARPPPEAPRTAGPALPVGEKAAERAPEYVLPEPSKRPAGTTVPFDNGEWGVLLDGRRALVSPRGVRLAAEVADAPLVRVEPMPARFGGGYLFRTSSSLFTSATFAGPLRAVVSLPGSITATSFGPDAVLVRAGTGERWLVDPATGARKAPAPVGLVDIAALDDGRSAAVTEAGGLSLSTDGGKTWKDGHSLLRGAAGGVVARDGELWVTDRSAQSTRALRLEPSGALSQVGVLPPAKPSAKPDPRFRMGESTLRLALRDGARLGPTTAVVAVGGDVLHVDLTSGAVLKTLAGAAPKNMVCEALEVPGDVLLVCVARALGSVVMSGLLAGSTPRLERSFAADRPFFAGEDGALAYAGPCTPPTLAATPVAPGTLPAREENLDVCARNTKGQWQSFRLKQGAAAGETRWIPRLEQPPIAVIAGKQMASFDVAEGEARPWRTEGHPAVLIEAARRVAPVQHGSGHRVVDRSWSATAEGRVRTMLSDGRALEVATDGAITVWPFSFDRVAVSGARAFASSKDGRAYQTLDGGRTWGEVQGPPGARPGLLEVQGCSALGCELGAFLRLGWEATPAEAPAEPTKVARPPTVATAPLVEMGCVSAGAGETRAVTPADESTDSLSLGAAFMPKLAVNDDLQRRRKLLGRAPVNVAIGTWDVDGEIAPRALLTDFPLTVEWVDRADGQDEEIVVLGPKRAASGFREEVLFVEPLLPAAPLRRVSFGLEAIKRAIKDSGVPLAQLVSSGALDASSVVPVTPAAGARTAPTGEVVVSFSPSHLGTFHVVASGGSAPRAEVLFTRKEGLGQSAARLARGDLLVLAVSEEGQGTILRFAPSGNSEVAQIPAPPQASLAPANPDALAIGPRGEIGVLRTPSGAEPPSVGDPALLILPGPQVTVLAPWSTALPADDPACVGDTDGYRATLQTMASWVRIAGRPFPDDSVVGMTARVRWSPSRVCIEAIEVPESTGNAPWGTPTETLVIATFAPPSAARASVELGSEARAPLSCALSPR